MPTTIASRTPSKLPSEVFGETTKFASFVIERALTFGRLPRIETAVRT
jgi:hypothetical protein